MATETIGKWTTPWTELEAETIRNEIDIWVYQGKTDGHATIVDNPDGSKDVIRIWTTNQDAVGLVTWMNANGFNAPRWTCQIVDLE